MDKIGILFNPKLDRAEALAGELTKALTDAGASAWYCSSWEGDKAREQVLSTGSELLVCLGGDGTILRAARIAASRPTLIIGMNLGRLGFMTELSVDEAFERIPDFLAGEGWVDERTMLQVKLDSPDANPHHVLNDVVLARGSRCRVIHIKAMVDGQPLTSYRCDGVIVSTATGSTGYSLASGGPILYPQAVEMLLQPIAPHLRLASGLVLPPEAVVELELTRADQEAILSLDGQVEFPAKAGDVVRVERSPYVTRLLRFQPAASFYGTLIDRLSSK